MSIRSQGSTLFTAILILVVTGVVLQLWLLTVSMDALLAHQFGILLPAAVASSVHFAINGGLLAYVFRFDREVQKGRQE